MPQADGRQSGSPVRPARSVLTRPTARSDARRVVVDRWRIRISQYQRPLRARRLRRPGFFTFSACSHLTPSEGWMERRQAHSFFLSRLRGATPALVRRGPVPVRPGPLSALHRGGFRMRTHASVSRQWNRSRSDCPRQAVTAWRSGSGPPAVRFAPQPRDATPRSAFRIVSGDAPHERGCESYSINPLRSQ